MVPKVSACDGDGDGDDDGGVDDGVAARPKFVLAPALTSSQESRNRKG